MKPCSNHVCEWYEPPFQGLNGCFFVQKWALRIKGTDDEIKIFLLTSIIILDFLLKKAWLLNPSCHFKGVNGYLKVLIYGLTQQCRGRILEHYSQSLPLGHLLMLSSVFWQMFYLYHRVVNRDLKGQVLEMKKLVLFTNFMTSKFKIILNSEYLMLFRLGSVYNMWCPYVT